MLLCSSIYNKYTCVYTSTIEYRDAHIHIWCPPSKIHQIETLVAMNLADLWRWGSESSESFLNHFDSGWEPRSKIPGRDPWAILDLGSQPKAR